MNEARSDIGVHFLQFLAYMSWTLEDWRKLTQFEATYFIEAYNESNARQRREVERARRR